MLNMMRICFLCIIAIMLSIIVVNDANGCSPVVRTISEKYFDADIVFLGELKKIEEPKDKSSEQLLKSNSKQVEELSTAIEYLYFSPKKIWKGSKEKEFILYRMKYQLSTCDIRFIEDKTYLIYAHVNNINGKKIYKTSWPSGTYLVSDLEKVITFGERRTIAQEFQKLDTLGKSFNFGGVQHYIISLSRIAVLGIFLCIGCASAVLYAVKYFKRDYTNYRYHLRKVCLIIVKLFCALYIGIVLFAFILQ